MSTPLPPIVEAVGVSKRFGSTVALQDVSVAIQPGRCLGLVGRNGAGKSTLVSILSGLLAPDSGEVRFAGAPAPSLSHTQAWRSRIATVFQHSMVVPNLTVAENVFLGHLPRKNGVIAWRQMREDTRRILREWNFDVSPDLPCSALTVEQRQIVEIAHALASGTRILLLDEPTAALEREAIRRLFDSVRALVAGGVAVLYISHHLEEVFEICHDVRVLRDGHLVLAAPTNTLDENKLVAAMVGDVQTAARRANTGRSKRTGEGQVDRLVVQDLVAESARGPLSGVSLTIGPGERVGVTGLLGAGVATLGRVIAGAHKYQSGSMTLDGKRLRNGARAHALASGIGYIPEDRWQEGFVDILGISENMTMSISQRLANRFGFLSPRRRDVAARPIAKQLSIVASGLHQPAGELSGGNQQKVTVARALASQPMLIVAITPTRGVDVASKELLLEALDRTTRDTGASLLLASDELPDLQFCDRVIVLVRGEVFATFDDPPYADEDLIAATEGLLPSGEGTR